MSSISERLLSALGGSYTIERELIGGGMAQVFVGEDHDLRRKVVMKLMKTRAFGSWRLVVPAR